MNRREFLGIPAVALASAAAAQDGWRTFAVTTRVEVQGAAGVTRAWLPLAWGGGPTYQRVLKQAWKGNAATLRAIREPTVGAGVLYAEWPAGESRPEAELTLTLATRDRIVDWRDRTVRGERAASLAPYLRPTRLLPLDGVVRETARRITRGESDDVARARAIYEWIVENTERHAAERGAGSGDIRRMLETGSLRGKSADFAALFVGLARSCGVPARDVYGLRVAPSRAFASLGRSGDVTNAQHCRPEFHSSRHGWVPVDPYGVREVIAEEKPGLTLASPEAAYARRQMFGAWEMNWIAFNDGRDVALPSATGQALPYFMYPQAEAGGKRLDSLDPPAFRYRIEAREL